MSGEVIRNFIIPICNDCVNLVGQECHTPDCTFFLCSMDEVSEYLNRLLIRPVIDGERVTEVCREEV